MKIWTSRYTLQKNSGGARKGALLRIDFGDGLLGYADCHPWVEFGDLALDDELGALVKGQCTQLTRRCLAFAKLDAEARKKKESWFRAKPLPESRAVLPKVGPIDHLQKLGYRSFKFKISSAIDWLPENVPICLDANGSLTPAEFETLFRRFPHVLFEDPVPFDKTLWTRWQKEGAQLAADRDVEAAVGFPEAAKFLVVKPAIHGDEILKKVANQKLIITSYLDHPVGQMCAGFMASQWAPDTICGIATHHFYHPTPYSELLGMGPHLSAPAGTGLGFDALLESESWNPLIF